MGSFSPPSIHSGLYNYFVHFSRSPSDVFLISDSTSCQVCAASSCREARVRMQMQVLYLLSLMGEHMHKIFWIHFIFYWIEIRSSNLVVPSSTSFSLVIKSIFTSILRTHYWSPNFWIPVCSDAFYLDTVYRCLPELTELDGRFMIGFELLYHLLEWADPK